MYTIWTKFWCRRKMFLKPFNTKANTVVSNGVRKQIRNALTQKFNVSDEADLNQIIPKKETFSLLRVHTQKKQKVNVYCVSKTPIVFEHEKVIYPTVYAAWIKPNLLKTLVIVPNAMNFLLSGADLMLPGIAMRQDELPLLESNEIVGIRAIGNLACVGVGVTLMSTEKMKENEMKGKGVKILHLFGDKLWAIEEKQIPMISVDNEEPISDTGELDKDISPDTYEEEHISTEMENLETDNDTEIKEMDQLLTLCALCAVKSVKVKELPILTSKFYGVYMKNEMCPEDKPFDIKKSSYKRVAKFIDMLVSEGVIKVKELTEGCSSIVEIDKKHPMMSLLKSNLKSVEEVPANTTEAFGVIVQDKYEAPVTTIIYGVGSGPILDLFTAMGYDKKSLFDAKEARDIVRKYVMENNLNTENNQVKLDPILHRIVYNKNTDDRETTNWKQLNESVISRMIEHYKMQFKGVDPIIQKGKVPNITITVKRQRGNKFATFVTNLESFFIKPDEFSKILCRKVQASSSVSKVPGYSGKQQVFCQGKQVKSVCELLQGDQYGLNHNYIKIIE